MLSTQRIIETTLCAEEPEPRTHEQRVCGAMPAPIGMAGSIRAVAHEREPFQADRLGVAERRR